MSQLKKVTREELEQKVLDIVCDQLGVDDSSKVTAASSIEGDLEADSLDVVELVMTFEEEFSLSIPEEDAKQLTTVGKITDYLWGKVQQQ